MAIADKHYSIKNTVQQGKNAVQPGDYIVLDQHMNMMCFSRQEFKTNFGHHALQVMDAVMEELNE